MSLNIFRDPKFFGGVRSNVVPSGSISLFVLLMLFFIAAAIPARAQTTFNGTFNVTENWSVTYIDAAYGRGLPTTVRGTETGTISINNGVYTLIDHTGLPNGDTFNTTAHSISGGPPYNCAGVEYPFAGSIFGTNSFVSVIHLSFFSIAISSSTYIADSVVANQSSLYSSFGQSLNALIGSGSNNVENFYYFTVSSSSSLSQQSYAPQITSGPDSQTVLVGSNATFHVSATGNPAPGYQWFYNGNAISGATFNQYTVLGAQTTNQGNYFVVVSNSIGSVESTNAVLTVSQPTPPVIAVQPQNETVIVGSNATMTVTATALPAPTYQWQINGTNIDLATGSSYTVTNAQLTSMGNYSVIVSNSVGSVVSSNGYLAVAVAPFFYSEVSLGEQWCWLDQNNDTNHIFGYFNYSPTNFPFMFHIDLGEEYFFDANNANGGGYFYDFGDGVFFYTEPGLFPYLYDFKANAWMWYDPDPTVGYGRYTSNPRWFYNFTANAWVNHL